MKHFATPQFWEAYEKLPVAVRGKANKQFELLKKDTSHPSLHLKKVGRYWSTRVDLQHRALAVDSGEGMLWFWIGDHQQYDRPIKS